jgi:hypothetical protein
MICKPILIKWLFMVVIILYNHQTHATNPFNYSHGWWHYCWCITSTRDWPYLSTVIDHYIIYKWNGYDDTTVITTYNYQNIPSLHHCSIIPGFVLVIPPFTDHFPFDSPYSPRSRGQKPSSVPRGFAQPGMIQTSPISRWQLWQIYPEVLVYHNGIYPWYIYLYNGIIINNGINYITIMTIMFIR